jgi:hypothetical protein
MAPETGDALWLAARWLDDLRLGGLRSQFLVLACFGADFQGSDHSRVRSWRDDHSCLMCFVWFALVSGVPPSDLELSGEAAAITGAGQADQLLRNAGCHSARLAYAMSVLL